MTESPIVLFPPFSFSIVYRNTHLIVLLRHCPCSNALYYYPELGFDSFGGERKRPVADAPAAAWGRRCACSRWTRTSPWCCSSSPSPWRRSWSSPLCRRLAAASSPSSSPDSILKHPCAAELLDLRSRRFLSSSFW